MSKVSKTKWKMSSWKQIANDTRTIPMSSRKFYKKTVQVEILMEDDKNLDGVDLTTLDFMIREGDCSAVTKVVKSQVLNGKQAAKALLEQGSDSEFFQLTPNGQDIGDYEFRK